MTEREGYADTRPTGMTVREQERRQRARAHGESGDPAEDNPSGEGTVSQKIERETVIGTHGHGGEWDLEEQQS
jgi:hypothetical protein